MKYEILVFGFGGASLKIYQYLDAELARRVDLVIEKQDLVDKNDYEIEEITLKALEPYVGKAEVIVIANPLVAMLVQAKLKQKWPAQRFVWYGQGMDELFEQDKKTFVLAPKRISRLETFQELKAKYQDKIIRQIDSSKWRELIERGWRARDEIDQELREINGAKVIIYDSEMLMREENVVEAVGWRGEVMNLLPEISTQVKQTMGCKY